MDAQPTKPPEAMGSMANINARATSTIIGAVEPSPSPTGRPWVGGAVYAPGAARFDDSARALTEDEMRRAAPSIFAARPHASRSERFRAIPTIEVLRGLEKEGFFAVGVKQSASRDASKTDYTRHMIRLRRLDNAQKYRVGDAVCEIILKNANDGTSAYELMAGLFRIRCLNSLVAQIATIDSIKVRHSGDALQKVVDATYRVLGRGRRGIGRAARLELHRARLRRQGRPGRERACAALRRRRRQGCDANQAGAAAHAAPRRRPRQRPLDGNERRSGERHARRFVGARAGDHGPARTLAAGPRGDDARGQQHRPGRKAQQGAVGSRRAHGELARTGRVAAPRCRVRRECDDKPEHRKTAWDPSAGLFSLRTSFGDVARVTMMRAAED